MRITLSDILFSIVFAIAIFMSLSFWETRKKCIKAWDRVNALENSPDLCYRCMDAEAMAAQEEAKRIAKLYNIDK